MTPTKDQVHAAAVKWCGEDFTKDIRWFEHYWPSFADLRALVELECSSVVEQRPEKGEPL